MVVDVEVVEYGFFVQFLFGVGVGVFLGLVVCVYDLFVGFGVVVQVDFGDFGVVGEWVLQFFEFVVVGGGF